METRGTESPGEVAARGVRSVWIVVAGVRCVGAIALGGKIVCRSGWNGGMGGCGGSVDSTRRSDRRTLNLSSDLRDEVLEVKPSD